MGDAKEIDTSDWRASAIPPEAYFTFTETEWLDLERAELAALKMSPGVPRHAVNDLVYLEAG